MFRRMSRLLKKSGKPGELPPYKQIYFPYEGSGPSASDIARERKKFMKAKGSFASNRGKLYDVKTVPEDMYTYGKAGMSVPISIFANEPDPVIAAEHTYPLIYENKLALKPYHLHELFDMDQANSFPSPLLKNRLENRIQHGISAFRQRLRWRVQQGHLRYLKEKGIGKGAKGSKTSPDAVDAAGSPSGKGDISKARR